jgi:hypothetical protein
MKKKLIIFLLCCICIVTNVVAQSADLQRKLDSLVGDKGIFKTMVEKPIGFDRDIHFNLRIYTKSNFGKNSNACFYVNTKEGIIGIIDITKNPTASFTNNHLTIMVIDKNANNLRFTIDKKGKKEVQSIPYSPLMESVPKEMQIKKMTDKNAKKIYAEEALTAFAYCNPMRVDMKKYLYGLRYPQDGFVKNYLGAFGVGFYNISGATYICMQSVFAEKEIEITKIESVDITLNTSQFKN